MIKLLPIIFILLLSLTAFGQAKKPAVLTKGNVQVEITDKGVTSELLPIPIAMSPNLRDAKIGIKYFGTTSESDISVVLLLKGTKSRYSTGEAFSVQVLIDDIPFSSGKYRIINSVDETEGGETIHFYITTEDLAWMTTAANLKISLFKTETETRLDTLTFTPATLAELKKFAQSVYFIRSKT